MSLISDALKVAQRERSGRNGERAAVPMAESISPVLGEEKTSRSTLLLVGGIVAAVLVIAALVTVRTRSAESAPSNTLATKASVTPAQPNAVAAPAIAPAPPIVPSSAAASLAAPISAPPKLAAPSTPSPRQPIALVAAQPRPANEGASPVRLVMDPIGMQPADSLSRLAYAEHVKNELDAARDLYEQAIAMEQAPAEAFNNYGVLLQQQGNRTKATEMFRQAIARDEKNVEAWVNLGDSFITAGHHGSALSAFDHARRLDPSRAAIKTRLANEYLEIGDTTAARRTYEDAVRVSPADARAHYAFGAFLLLVKEYGAAIREFDLFIENAEKTSGEFTPEKIGDVKRYVASLRRATP